MSGVTEMASHVLDGVTVPLVTTMTEDRIPDAALSAPLLQSMADAGVDNLMLLGSNGEGALLPTEQSTPYAVDAARAWRSISSKPNLFVTVFGAGTEIGLRNARSFMAAEPSAFVVAAPIYFGHTEDELADHFAAFAQFGVPVIAYNIPRYTGNPLTLGLLERLIQMPHIVGMKDSSASDEYLLGALELAASRPDFGISQGNEKRLGWAMEVGARGLTPGLANIAPKLCMDVVAAARAAEWDRVAALQEKLTALTAIHSIRPGVAAMKASLSLLGVSPKTPAAPFRAYAQNELDQLKSILAPMLSDIGGAFV